MILPAVAVAYLMCGPSLWRTRVLRLAVVGLVVVVATLAWPALVDLTPTSQRPYVEGTAHDHELELTFITNGLDRLVGSRRPARPLQPAHRATGAARANATGTNAALRPRPTPDPARSARGDRCGSWAAGSVVRSAGWSPWPGWPRPAACGWPGGADAQGRCVRRVDPLGRMADHRRGRHQLRRWGVPPLLRQRDRAAGRRHGRGRPGPVGEGVAGRAGPWAGCWRSPSVAPPRWAS